MTTATLIDGTEVDSADPRWRAECLDVHRHVYAMRSMSIPMRRSHLHAIARDYGATMRERVAEAFAADWRERRKEQTT